MPEIIRPGVEVLQELATASPTIFLPTLRPCVVGPAFEVIKARTSLGEINEDALYTAAQYANEGMRIEKEDYPSPRSNIDEVDVLEQETKLYLLRSGDLERRKPGEGFLYSWNHQSTVSAQNRATRPYLMSGDLTAPAGGLGPYTALNIVGKTFIFAFDSYSSTGVPAAANVTVTFTRALPTIATLTLDQAITQINTAAGYTVASKYEVGGKFLVMSSPNYGSAAKIVVRSSGTANLDLQFSAVSESSSFGAGLYVDDDYNNDTYGSWVRYSRGEATYVDPLVGGGTVTGGFYNISSPTTMQVVATGGKHQVAINFLTDVCLRAGDELYAGGVKTGDEIRTVEPSRFQLGTINSTLSVYDSSTEEYTTKVVDPYYVKHQYASGAFSPKYWWFKGQNLLYPATTANKALIQYANAAAPASAAEITASFAVTIGAGPDFTIAAGTMVVRYYKDGVAYDKTITVPEYTGLTADASFDSLKTFLNLLSNTDFIGDGAADVIWSENIPGDHILVLTALATGDAIGLQFLTGTATQYGLDDEIEDPPTYGTDKGWAGLGGKGLQITVDDSSTPYTVTFATDSAEDIVAAFEAGCPALTATVDGTDQLELESNTGGLNSNLVVIDDPSATGALAILGAASVLVSGANRPNADVAFTSGGDIVLQRSMVRHPVTGDPEGETDSIYIQYRGLRLDVSSDAAVPALLDIEDTATLEAVLGPLTTENPLGLAASYCLINSGNASITCLGVSEVTAGAPMGTLNAYTKAAEFLESKDVYAIAPLTDDADVIQMFSNHVQTCSQAEQRRWRVLLGSLAFPTHAVDTLVGSGSNLDATPSNNVVSVENNINSALLANGINPADVLTIDDGVFLTIAVDGENRHYLITTVTGGTQFTLTTTFASDENVDGFYSTDTLVASSVEDLDWSVKIRGALLVMTGTDIMDKAAVATTAADQGRAYNRRRTILGFGDSVSVSVDGVTTELPLYYYMVGEAGNVAAKPPQQGHTNLGTAGYLSVAGTNDIFTESKLNEIAGGGRWIPIQEVVGGPVFCRHQLTTNVTTVENREFSITKVLDYCSYIFYYGLRSYIGTSNITQDLLDDLSTACQGIGEFLVENRILTSCSLESISQNTNEPDRVDIRIVVKVPYPCNYIRITLVV